MQALTKQENVVAELITNEFTVDEISVKLCISSHTVVSHKKNIFQKLDVKNIAGVARKYVIAHKDLFFSVVFLSIQFYCISIDTQQVRIFKTAKTAKVSRVIKGKRNEG